jgi:aminoglycoside phosphotransferase (APT) family kinase protein
LNGATPAMETTSDRLLAYLRARLGSGVEFAAPPVPLSGGFDTTVMAFALRGVPAEWQGDLILRVMGFAASAVRVRREAATHAALVEAGFPAPRILLAEPEGAALGKPFLIMERIAGETMWTSIVGPNGRLRRLLDMPRQLGEIHAQLHGIAGATLLASARRFDVDPDLLTLAGEVRRLHRRAEEAGLSGLLPGTTWLQRNLPAPAQPETICHGDFHPLNIMVDGERFTGVIDWPQAIVAEAAYDVGATRLLGRFANLNDVAWIRGASDLARRRMLHRYELAYRTRRPLDGRNIPFFEAMRGLSALIFAGERPGPGNPWGAPHTVAALCRHFRQIAGVELRP